MSYANWADQENYAAISKDARAWLQTDSPSLNDVLEGPLRRLFELAILEKHDRVAARIVEFARGLVQELPDSAGESFNAADGELRHQLRQFSSERDWLLDVLAGHRTHNG